MKKQNYTREEVIQVIEQILTMPDKVMDAITSESPNNDAEDLLELADYFLAQSK